jgi:NADH dehydrogenase subunit G (EC 1.6.5.3)
MAKIHVDGVTYEVRDADNLLQAVLSKDIDLPYFCWHPAMGSVGACRQCAVKQYQDENDQNGKIVMACLTPCTDGSRFTVEDDDSKAFRASVIEWLMTNHPHDCPVCEEGGHCHLQDMTVMSGHVSRRYRYSKRTHLNQQLGPFIEHEMNRCIACYRCTRYYKDYADGTDFGVYGARENVYFGRERDGTLESEFSGNLIEICPTGVFTDKTHSQRYTRKWDMQFAPGICTACSLGCNVSPGERYGEIRRIENRYNGAVNHYFLCDRGRFGYGYVNREDRPRQPRLRRDERQVEVSVSSALDYVGGLLRGARRVIGIGSPRASLEANFELRQLVGAGNFFDGHAGEDGALVRLALRILREGSAKPVSLREMEKADAVFVVGEDITQTAARMALALRQAARSIGPKLAAKVRIPAWQTLAVADVRQHALYPVHIAAVGATRLDDIAASLHRGSPEAIARLTQAVAHAVDAEAGAIGNPTAEDTAQARRIADDLLAAERPLLVSGTGLGSATVLEATANLARALHQKGKAVEIALALPEANSLGLAMMEPGSLTEALRQLASGEADVAVVLENDLYRRAAAADVDAAFRHARVVALDHQDNRTVQHAHVVLPAATVFESDGTYVNNEGRAQRSFQVFDPAYYDRAVNTAEAWRWLSELRHSVQGAGTGVARLDLVLDEMAQAIPTLQGVRKAAPNAQFRIDGLRMARAPARASGRTALRAQYTVHEPRTTQDDDSPLAFSMEGFAGPETPGALIPFAWAPGWDSPQAWNKFQDEVGGQLRGGDPGVCLIEPAGTGGYLPLADTAPASGLRAVPLFHLFGGEELSAAAAPIGARAPNPYVAISSADSGQLGLKTGEIASIDVGGRQLRLTVQVQVDLAAGLLGLPYDLLGIPVLPVSTPVHISKVAAA